MPLSRRVGTLPGAKQIMHDISTTMRPRKRAALIAHDNCKTDVLDWARYNEGTLSLHELFATGTTGTRVETAWGCA